MTQTIPPPRPVTPTSTSTSPAPILATPAAATVLVIEDNIINQTVLSRQLRQAGFSVLTADNGQQGLTSLDEHRETVSIVLCDLEMPVMDGMTFIKHIVRLREMGQLQGLPILAVTGNARLEQVQAAKDAGFDDVVCKPYSIKKLVPMMRDWIAEASMDA
ncbi:hypothetical protein ANO11243_093990 [Dothideomycetidae sp. 11243]|nr:hypothetical protein ANO11243_093990 [fungal sp. No.11243]